MTNPYEVDESPMTCFDCSAESPSVTMIRRTNLGESRVLVCHDCAAQWPEDEHLETPEAYDLEESA